MLECVHSTYDPTAATGIEWGGHWTYPAPAELTEMTDVHWLYVPCKRVHFTYFGSEETRDRNHSYSDFVGVVVHNTATGTADAYLYSREPGKSGEAVFHRVYRPGETGDMPFRDLADERIRLMIED